MFTSSDHTAPLAEQVMPRFGEFLRDNGYISDSHLQAGLAAQRAAAARGQNQTIGQTLLALGALSREQLDQAGVQHVRLYQEALQAIIRQLEQHVTERTLELQQALQRLTELNDLKANFVANISHELRTPLVPIKGYLDVLLTGGLGDMTPPQREALAVVQRSAGRLERLISELILFASSIKGRLVITPTIFALEDLTGRLIEYFTPRAEAAEVRLQADVPTDFPLFSADGEKIYWVLFQLLDNALKFTPPGGGVVLGAQRQRERLRLWVSDTGPGIPPERITEIFEPFHKLSEGTEDRLYDGAGLGLSLAKRILEAHGSRLEVTSQPGQGATFSFSLPVAQRAA